MPRLIALLAALTTLCLAGSAFAQNTGETWADVLADEIETHTDVLGDLNAELQTVWGADLASLNAQKAIHARIAAENAAHRAEKAEMLRLQKLGAAASTYVPVTPPPPVEPDHDHSLSLFELLFGQ